jgi:hypothetical protein
VVCDVCCVMLAVLCDTAVLTNRYYFPSSSYSIASPAHTSKASISTETHTDASVAAAAPVIAFGGSYGGMFIIWFTRDRGFIICMMVYYFGL